MEGRGVLEVYVCEESIVRGMINYGYCEVSNSK